MKNKMFASLVCIDYSMHSMLLHRLTANFSDFLLGEPILFYKGKACGVVHLILPGNNVILRIR